MRASLTPGSVEVNHVSAVVYSGIVMITVGTKQKRPECVLGSSSGPNKERGVLIYLGNESEEPDTLVEVTAESEDEMAMFSSGLTCIYECRYGPTVLIVPAPGEREEMKELYSK